MDERGARRPRPRPPTELAAGVSPPGEVKPVVVPEAEARTKENAAPSKGLPSQASVVVGVVPSYSRVHREVSGVNVDVAVTSLWPARLIVTRMPSGTRYEWPQAGSMVLVKAEDIPELRAKNDRSQRPCCGQEAGRIYFQFPQD